MPDVRLVVAGDPVDPIAAVRELAQQHGVDERIEWRLHFVPENEIKELMTQAAAVVLPYRQLDSSGVLATAIGYRRAVVVTDVGSLGRSCVSSTRARSLRPMTSMRLPWLVCGCSSRRDSGKRLQGPVGPQRS